MWGQIGQLHEYHRDVAVEIRLLKLTEEVGEVAEAFCASTGRIAAKESAVLATIFWTNYPT